MFSGNLLRRRLIGVPGHLTTQLFHFLIRIAVLQGLAQGIGYIIRMNPQSCHGAGSLHGLQGQLFCLASCLLSGLGP